MERFITTCLEIYLNEINKDEETNYTLVGIRHEQFDIESEIVLDLYDRTTKEKRTMHLFEFRDKLLGKIKRKIIHKIEENEFDEIIDLMEQYRTAQERLE